MAKVTTSKKQPKQQPEATQTTAKAEETYVTKAELDSMLEGAFDKIAAQIAAMANPTAAKVEQIESIDTDDYVPSAETQVDIEEEINRVPGGQKIQATYNEDALRVPTKEELESWSEERVTAYNNAQAERMRQMKQKQRENRKSLDEMSRGDRIRALQGDRDPNVIRESINPDNERMVSVIAKVRVALNDVDMADLGETIKLPLSTAKALQAQGKIEVPLA